MPTRRSPDHSGTSEPGDERMTDALVALHERLLQTEHLDGKSNEERTSSGEGSLTANELLAKPDLDDLADCLERLEETRRFELAETPASVLHFTIGAAGDDSAEFGDATNQESRIGRFEILRELGRGGLGVVLLAYDPVLKRQVALKIPNPEGIVSPSLRRRFQREGHAAARLQHPHIVPVYEVGEIGPICFIAAAYVEGPNLAQWLAERRGACDPRVAVRLVADLADAMHYAHEQRVLHRDLKPSNILLERSLTPLNASDSAPTPDALQAKITDFGLAKIIDQQEDETRHGTVLGTPAYMAPEQARGDTALIGRASDVYSLGAILYELLSGQTPYAADSDAGVLARILGPEEPEPLRRRSPNVPRDLEAICHLCLEKAPAARYATAGELAADLRRFLAGEPTQARPLSVGQRLARWSRRKPALAALLAVSLLAVVALSLGGGFYARDLSQALSLAQVNATRAEENQRQSRQHESRANEQLYAANMRIADLALHEGDATRARTLLDKYCDGTSLANLRGIEWSILWWQLLRMENQGDQSATTVLDHTKPMFAVAALPDSRYVATGGEDGRLRIWDHQAQKLTQEIPVHEVCLNEIELSPDGTMVATGSCDRTATVWSLSADNKLNLVRTIRHEQPVRRIAWSADGSLLATTTSVDDPQNQINQLQIWDVSSGERLYNGPCQAGVGLIWSLEGQHVITAGNGEIKSLRVSDWTNQTFQLPENSYGASHHPSGSITFSEAWTGLRELDPRTGLSRLLSRTPHFGLSAWHPNHKMLALLGQDTMVRIYYPHEAYREESFCQRNRGSQMGDLAFSRDGRYLLSADFSGRVCVTDLNAQLSLPPTVIQRHSVEEDLVPRSIETNGSHVTLSSADGSTFRFEVEWDQAVSRDRRIRQTSSRLRQLPSKDFACGFGRRRLEQAEDRSFTLYHVDEDRVEPLGLNIGVFILESTVVERANRAVGFCQGDLTVIDLAAKKIVYQQNDTAYRQLAAPLLHSLDLSADGRWLVTTNTPSGARLIDLETGTIRLLTPPGDTGGRYRSLRISQDGRRAALIHEDTTIRIWDLPSCHEILRLDVGDYAHALTFDSQGRSLVVGTKDGLQIWHAGTGERMAKLDIDHGVRVVQLSDDDRTLYCVSSDGSSTRIYRWQMDQEGKGRMPSAVAGQ